MAINGFINAGFDLERLVEPTLPFGDYQEMLLQRSRQIPRALIVESVTVDSPRPCVAAQSLHPLGHKLLI